MFLIAARTEGSVALEPATLSQGAAGVAQQGKGIQASYWHDPWLTMIQQHPAFLSHSTLWLQLSHRAIKPPPTPLASHRQHPNQSPTLQRCDRRIEVARHHRPWRFARDLRELQSGELGARERLTRTRDQRQQLLSHLKSAKAEIDELEGRLEREESVEGSQDILNRLRDLSGLHEWAGYKWKKLGDEVEELETEIAMG